MKNKNAKLMVLHDRLKAMDSIIRSRTELLGRMGKSFKDARDLYQTLGYKKEPEFEDYFARYLRQDMASTIVNAPVDGCWCVNPTIEESSKEEETEFEVKWKELLDEKRIFHCFARVDKLAGIGKFALLLIGVNDGRELSMPIGSADRLLYLQTYKESDVQVSVWNTNVSDERYGMPEIYDIKVMTSNRHKTQTKQVHWSRCIHIVDNDIDNDIAGESRLQNVLNRLQDLELVAGGSAEMFWRGAMPGMAFILDEDSQLDPEQGTEDLEEEIEAYIHNMQRYLKLQGMQVQQLSPTVVDPSGHVGVYLDLIAGATRIPKRILIGSERGELASTQDSDSWAKIVQKRRSQYCEPVIIRPFIDRLIQVGVLPKTEDRYTVEWVGFDAPTDQDKATLGQTKTATLATYVNAMGADQILPPKVFLSKMLDLTDEDIEMIEEIVGGDLNEEIEREEKNVEEKEEEEKE